jgi:ParB-like chromosome segregation protein Spo0J
MRTSNRQMQGGSSGMHPERRIKLHSIRCDDLPPHPLSVKIYGTPKPTPELLRSIENVGLLQPLIVNDYGDGSHELLVGNTRAEAWRMLLKQKKISTVWISCRLVTLSPLEAERFVIESNRQRVKTAEQKGREFKELKRIEAAIAKEKESERKQQAKTTSANLPKSTPTPAPTSKHDSRAKAAEAVGLKPRTADKLEKIVDAKDAGDVKAAAALAEIEVKKGRGVDAAYRAVIQPQPPKDPELVQAQKKSAQELQALLRTNGLDADISRSKSEGEFHVTLHGLTETQVRQLPDLLASLSKRKAAA